VAAADGTERSVFAVGPITIGRSRFYPLGGGFCACEQDLLDEDGLAIGTNVLRAPWRVLSISHHGGTVSRSAPSL